MYLGENMTFEKKKGCGENHEKINYLGPLHNTGKKTFNSERNSEN